MEKNKAAAAAVVDREVAGAVGREPAVADRAAAVDRPLPIAAPRRNRVDSAAAPSAGSANPMNAVFPASCKNAPHAAAP